MNSGRTDTLSRFKALEDRIARALETLALTRRDKNRLERELADARRQIRALEERVEELQAERGEVRNRVEALISSITRLERAKEEKIV